MDPGELSFLQRDVLLRQHRLFLYRVVVQRTKARLIYLDHAGIRISDEFDWTVVNSFLHIFVWKLAQMTAEELGFDPTAELATATEVCVLREAITDGGLPRHVEEATKATFDGRCPVYRLRITVADPLPDEAFPTDPPVLLPPPNTALGQYGPGVIPKGEHFFLVGRPHFQADRFVGRSTGGFVAFDLQAQRFCFVKDYWRPLAPHRGRPEHLVYERLHAVQTPFIATLTCGGDVGGPRAQKTHVQDEFSKDRVVPRVHYRLALVEVGMPLKAFNGFRDLANVLAQAIAGTPLFAIRRSIQPSGLISTQRTLTPSSTPGSCTGMSALAISSSSPIEPHSLSIGTTVDWYLSSKQAPLSHDMRYVIQCNYNYSGR